MKKKLLRILIIEDNIDHVELLSQVIERNFAPIDLHTVETVDDALDFIEQAEYDIVFTDCYIGGESIIPQINGLRNRLGMTPIIVITGSGDESLAAEVIKRGATDYLVKTRDSIERIPSLIKKYTIDEPAGRHPASHHGRDGNPLREKLFNEVATLGRRARRMSEPHAGKIPDVKQLESLLDQIQKLKELAAKLMNK